MHSGGAARPSKKFWAQFQRRDQNQKVQQGKQSIAAQTFQRKCKEASGTLKGTKYKRADQAKKDAKDKFRDSRPITVEGLASGQRVPKRKDQLKYTKIWPDSITLQLFKDRTTTHCETADIPQHLIKPQGHKPGQKSQSGSPSRRPHSMNLYEGHPHSK